MIENNYAISMAGSDALRWLVNPAANGCRQTRSIEMQLLSTCVRDNACRRHDPARPAIVSGNYTSLKARLYYKRNVIFLPHATRLHFPMLWLMNAHFGGVIQLFAVHIYKIKSF